MDPFLCLQKFKTICHQITCPPAPCASPSFVEGECCPSCLRCKCTRSSGRRLLSCSEPEALPAELPPARGLARESRRAAICPLHGVSFMVKTDSIKVDRVHASA